MSAEVISRSFARLLADEDRETSASPVWIGLEHEYRVLGPQGTVDFRQVIRGLDLGQTFLNPTDAYGYRLPSGSWLTSDGAEAEIALPPVLLEPEFTTKLAAGAGAERLALERRLPPSLRLKGFSTHLSVSAPPKLNRQAVRLFACTFAPALMLLLEGPLSPGLILRPRPGRFEVGGEYAAGAGLGAAAVMAAGGALACLGAVAGWGKGRLFPPKLQVKLTPTWQRYGWYADRRSFGPDLYREGRSAVLRTVWGRRIKAQDQLAVAWAAAKAALGPQIAATDRLAAEEMVDGVRCLAVEGGPLDEAWVPAGDISGAAAFGATLRMRGRPGFEMGTVLSCWDTTVFVVSTADRTRRAFACLSRVYLDPFFRLLQSGRLDEVINAYLAQVPSGRILRAYRQTLDPGLYDEMGSRQELLAPERAPEGGCP